jgi:LPS export ABC transporter protein LptC
MRDVRQRWLIGIVGTAIGSLVALGVAAGKPPAPQFPRPKSVPETRITNFHLVESKGGVKLWEIWGDLAEVFEKDGLALVTKVSRQVTVAFHSEEGTLTSHSDKATINMRTKDVRLQGKVRATSEQGSTLQTESLHWSAEDRRLYTPSPVTLAKGGLVSRGIGMEAETTLERVRLFGRVRSRVAPDSNDKAKQELPVTRKGRT